MTRIRRLCHYFRRRYALVVAVAVAEVVVVVDNVDHRSHLGYWIRRDCQMSLGCLKVRHLRRDVRMLTNLNAIFCISMMQIE